MPQGGGVTQRDRGGGEQETRGDKSDDDDAYQLGNLSCVYVRHILTAFCFLFDFNAISPSIFLQLLQRLCERSEASNQTTGKAQKISRGEEREGPSSLLSTGPSQNTENARGETSTICPKKDRAGDIAVVNSRGGGEQEKKKSGAPLLLSSPSPPAPRLTEFQVECLLMMLRLGGGKLRNESPALFKEAWTSLMRVASSAGEGGGLGDKEEDFQHDGLGSKKKSGKRREMVRGGSEGKRGSARTSLGGIQGEGGGEQEEEEEDMFSIEEQKRRLMMRRGGRRLWGLSEGGDGGRTEGRGHEIRQNGRSPPRQRRLRVLGMVMDAGSPVEGAPLWHVIRCQRMTLGVYIHHTHSVLIYYIDHRRMWFVDEIHSTDVLEVPAQRHIDLHSCGVYVHTAAVCCWMYEEVRSPLSVFLSCSLVRRCRHAARGGGQNREKMRSRVR